MRASRFTLAAVVAGLVLACTAYAAEPPTRIIYLHYDYMVKEGPGGHSHAPDPRAIQVVVEAFRRQGITLHVDPVHNAIPERAVVTQAPQTKLACTGPDAVTLTELRDAYFRSHGEHQWHYAVFGHNAICPDAAHCLACQGDAACGGKPDPTATGFAELPGLNFAVTFGPYVDAGQPVLVGTQAGTFMHELGHNLGLLHGGADECVNQKPNYVSVMNYLYQLGIPIAATPGSTDFQVCATDHECGPGGLCDLGLADVVGAPICLRVDYSAQALPSLNEFTPVPGVGGLDETVGFGGDPGDAELLLYFVPGPTQFLATASGPVDFNNDGAIGTHVSADLNNDGSYTLLRGFDDWAYLHAALNTPGHWERASGHVPAVTSCTPGRR